MEKATLLFISLITAAVVAIIIIRACMKKNGGAGCPGSGGTGNGPGEIPGDEKPPDEMHRPE